MSNLSFEEEYFAVLQSIEQAIHTVYQENPDLVDYNVDKVLDGVVRTLSNQQKGRKAPKLRLKPVEQSIYDSLEGVANVYLGRDADINFGDESLTVDEMVACFKRIQRSIKLMSDQGRQGYLHFIDQFFGG